MAFNPATGLVYLSAKAGTQFVHAPKAKWQYNGDRDNIGLDEAYDGPLNNQVAKLAPPAGELVAWDPVRQKAAWVAKYPVAEGGGVLATAGNVVFQGRADGMFAAYRATDGQQLWTFDAGTGIIGAPVTYLVNGAQYVSVLAGWGGAAALFNAPGSGTVKPGFGRILTFAVGGTATFKPPAYGHKGSLSLVLTVAASPQMVREGGQIFNSQCAGCHGINAVAGPVPDLRYASKETLEGIEEIVLGGSRASAGMPSFQKILTAPQVHEIRAYIVARARESAKAAALDTRR
jgi:quinohemoprotein ethanol dehydrogenase